MRQLLAVWTALLCLALVALLSLQVARELNRDGPAFSAAWPEEEEHDPDAAAGRAVYRESGCSVCHSIAGVGNLRNPLDGLSQRLEADRVAVWVVGDESLADSLPPSTMRRKRAYRDLSRDELEALVAYLLSLEGP